LQRRLGLDVLIPTAILREVITVEKWLWDSIELSLDDVLCLRLGGPKVDQSTFQKTGYFRGDVVASITVILLEILRKYSFVWCWEGSKARYVSVEDLKLAEKESTRWSLISLDLRSGLELGRLMVILEFHQTRATP
jgi:hypothetical protein